MSGVLCVVWRVQQARSGFKQLFGIADLEKHALSPLSIILPPGKQDLYLIDWPALFCALLCDILVAFSSTRQVAATTLFRSNHATRAFLPIERMCDYTQIGCIRREPVAFVFLQGDRTYSPVRFMRLQNPAAALFKAGFRAIAGYLRFSDG